MTSRFARLLSCPIGLSMWSFRTIAFLAVLGLLGACGFRPLYGDRTAAGGAPSELASIKIAAIPDRIGQQLHNYLLTALNPRGQPRRPRYILHTRINESISSLAVRKSAFATRANLAVTAHYNLAPLCRRPVFVFSKKFHNGQLQYSGLRVRHPDGRKGCPCPRHPRNKRGHPDPVERFPRQPAGPR